MRNVGNYIKNARRILERQPWAQGSWFANDYNSSEQRGFRRMDDETGEILVDGKLIPFTKTTAVCAMGAVEAALVEDRNLTPSLRRDLYNEIQRLLSEKAMLKMPYLRDDYESYVDGFKWDKEYGYRDPEEELLTFEEWAADAAAEGDYTVITYNDDYAESKEDVLEVFDETLDGLHAPALA